ncbi:TPA: hypothetical protein DEW47_03870 [Patescibacteria group bacterium]|nr:hypothetical protein [Patescibacteria group bacterium]HCI05079.1 hypothetical protein [Patescibacteria group bacterium]
MSLRGLTDRGSYSRTPANISEFASSACGSCEVAGKGATLKSEISLREPKEILEEMKKSILNKAFKGEP